MGVTVSLLSGSLIPVPGLFKDSLTPGIFRVPPRSHKQKAMTFSTTINIIICRDVIYNSVPENYSNFAGTYYLLV